MNALLEQAMLSKSNQISYSYITLDFAAICCWVWSSSNNWKITYFGGGAGEGGEMEREESATLKHKCLLSSWKKKLIIPYKWK